MQELPTISVVTPTFNAGRTLERCLRSIRAQDYPKSKLEIVIVDGGSTDRTLEIARAFGTKLQKNPLKTGEAGKAVGVRAARNELVALIDSDNILPTKTWLRQMVAPFAEPNVLAAEPIRFVHRKTDSPLTRYTAMLGMSDPLVLWMGNYDKECLLTGKWTEVPRKEEDHGGWLAVHFEPRHLPTIGANGTLIRRSALVKELNSDDYLFDIDIIYRLLLKKRYVIAKVKVGIVHLFSGDAKTFARKQLRRVRDYLYYQRLGVRAYPWSAPKGKLVGFALSSIATIPTIGQALKGYAKSRDTAWFFHPLACWITLLTYGWGRVSSIFVRQPLSRTGWRQ